MPKQTVGEPGPGDYRVERDSMGEVRVPAGAYYGAQTQRAVLNFPISNLRFSRRFIWALGLIKREATRVNHALDLLGGDISRAIMEAASEVTEGAWDSEFVIDIFQTGSGTSTNMNANEVIANRAAELLGHPRGSKVVHPNDHVNMGQSSNDVIPTAMHVAAAAAMHDELVPALERLRAGLTRKAREFDRTVKIGRTHLQDATPIRLGQEFSGYASQVEHGVSRAKRALDELLELAIGGTAVGTGMNTHPDFASRVVQRLSDELGLHFREASNHFEAQAAQDAVVFASGALKTIATSLMKIANDLRWLSSGPRAGIGELRLPEVQPGSSIMPGKVNPVIAESVVMVCAQVMGNDTAIMVGGQHGNFELNVMLPVMAHNLLQSIELLASSADNLHDKCVVGIRADEERCRSLVQQSLALVTALAPEVGYDRAAKLAKQAHDEGKTIREVAMAQEVLPPEKLNELLDPMRQTRQ